jgi:hypothetical protein
MFRRETLVMLPRLVVLSQLVHAGISTFTFPPLPPPETASTKGHVSRTPNVGPSTRTHSHERDASSDQEHEDHHPTDDGTLVPTQERLYVVPPARVRIRVHVVPARKGARARRVARVIAVLRETLRTHVRAWWYRREREPGAIERGALQTCAPVGVGRGGVGREAAEGVLECLVDQYGGRKRAVEELQVVGARCRECVKRWNTGWGPTWTREHSRPTEAN